jgi:hypothetical protein
MKLLRRHKSVLIALGIYWPVIFWLTHIPVPELARQSGMSDKTMHVLAYFVLTFLAWFAISPYEKIHWRSKKAWVLFGALVLYGAFDEILQGHVGRSADVADFAADVVGVTAAFVLLSVLSFWPALLAASAVFVFVVTNQSNLLMLYPEYYLNMAFHYTAYTAFTLIWIQHMERYTRVRAAGVAWLLVSMLVPLGLLVMIKGTAPLFGRSIDWFETATAGFGIGSALLISWVTIRLARRRSR